jgi:hypothetical protein
VIPIGLRLDIQARERSRVVLWFPVIVVWLLVFALMIAALPFVLIGALATMSGGHGKRLLLTYLMVFQIIGALSGLRIDVDGRGRDRVFISLD